jgi:hypothetical protein
VQVLEATIFLVKFESISRGSCVQSKREIFFVSLGGGGGGGGGAQWIGGYG